MLNMSTFAKIKGFGGQVGDCLHIARDLDGLEIVEADLVPRCHAELAIGRVIGGSFYPPKAPAAGSVFG